MTVRNNGSTQMEQWYHGEQLRHCYLQQWVLVEQCIVLKTKGSLEDDVLFGRPEIVVGSTRLWQ